MVEGSDLGPGGHEARCRAGLTEACSDPAAQSPKPCHPDWSM